MITLLISILSGLATMAVLRQTTDLSLFWSVVFALAVTLLVQMAFGLILRKKVDKVLNAIQSVIMEGQERLNRKADMFQLKPAGGVNHMRKILEREQQAFIRKALELTKELEPYFKWSPLLKKQVATMRMQFHYQLGEFDEVDKLLPDCLFLDPMTVAMKMARMYKNNSPGLDKFYRRKARKFKDDKGILVHALYTWILVKRGEVDKALEILTELKEKTSNETIIRNWEALANGKVKSFSNAGLGEQWYALRLETPKASSGGGGKKARKRIK